MRNLFVCLVHEEPEVIRDLVRNLRYLDPDSSVLLYNGGGNPALLDDWRSSRDPQVFIHPQPRTQSHGALQGFIIDGMRWARENLPFDAITNVDSD